MELVNFELANPSFSIELFGLGFVWDLHNAATFLGITLDANDNSAVMKWSTSGHPAAKYNGCDLVFKDLENIVVSARDKELPYSEDLCVSSISKVSAESVDIPERRIKVAWNPGDPYRLLFQFQSRRYIEIGAKTAELIGIP